MRRVIIEASCDLHADRAAEGEATIIIGKTERLVDLCGECMGMVTALHDLGVLPEQAIDKAKAKPKAKPSVVQYDKDGVRIGFVDDGLSCPYDDYHGPTRAALGAHVKQHHDLGMRDLAERGLVKSQLGQRH